MKRRIFYLSGSRADFGLMANSLWAIASDPRFELEIIATGQHLSPLHGLTVTELEAAGFRVTRLPQVPMTGTDRLEMSQSVALQMHAISVALAQSRPDLLIILGDRGEMLAGALAAVFLGIPIAHFHGGDRSGSVDDQLRRAITALAHFHFPATAAAKSNLIRMGEVDKNIFLLGAPGLDEIKHVSLLPSQTIRSDLGLDQRRKIITCVFHPVIQDAERASEQTQTLLNVLVKQDAEVVVLSPNSDAGSAAISEAYRKIREDKSQSSKSAAKLTWLTHLERLRYLSLISASDLLIGNSSSGIIETASLRTPVVNVGDRQAYRERNDSVFDCAPNEREIEGAILSALAYKGSFENVYDSGGCANRLPDVLAGLNASPSVMKKPFYY